MLTDRDVIFSILYAAVMAVIFGASTWFVYFRYGQCIQHLEDRENSEVIRRDIASLTFDAMMALAWGILTGIAMGSLAKEVRWIEAALMAGALGFVGFLSVRPFKQMVHRARPADPAR